jgi:hypothetical protein
MFASAAFSMVGHLLLISLENQLNDIVTVQLYSIVVKPLSDW